MEDQENASFGLIVSFPDQSDSFVNGYEAGLLQAEMQSSIDPIERPIHTKNVELVRRMCAAWGWSPSFEDTEFGEWTRMRLVRGARPNLSVVQ